MSLNDFTINFSGSVLTAIPNVNFARRFPHDLPERKLQYGTLARAHGEKLLSSFYGSKPIVMEGYIGAAPGEEPISRAEMELARDLLIVATQKQEGNLEIAQAGATRVYQATMGNIIFTPVEGGYMTFNIEFKCANPFGRDASQTLLSFSPHQTTTPKDYEVEIGGTFYGELVITITINSGSGLISNKTVTVSNPATGEQISITRNWTAGDVIQIHVPNKSVTVNNISVDYSGVFPLWEPGFGLMRYTDTFTTRNVSMGASYYKRYL